MNELDKNNNNNNNKKQICVKEELRNWEPEWKGHNAVKP
jgi:hypothetical protein